ncbi:MAG: hypothetical protein U0354_15360 [Candidatus Sericytochromatia bacterium]
MRKSLLILAVLLFLPTACHVCVGQANVGGVNNNACCTSKELIVISKEVKGETSVVSQNPSSSTVPTSTPSPVSTPTTSPVPSPTATPI